MRNFVSFEWGAPDEDQLISDAPLGLLAKLRGQSHAPALFRVCVGLDHSLRNLPLTRNVQWFTSKEFQQSGGRGGASAPNS